MPGHGAGRLCQPARPGETMAARLSTPRAAPMAVVSRSNGMATAAQQHLSPMPVLTTPTRRRRHGLGAAYSLQTATGQRSHRQRRQRRCRAGCFAGTGTAAIQPMHRGQPQLARPAGREPFSQSHRLPMQHGFELQTGDAVYLGESASKPATRPAIIDC